MTASERSFDSECRLIDTVRVTGSVDVNIAKVRGPRLPAGLIERKGLESSFAALATARLGVVRAPAGAGKTSLVSQWRARLVGAGRPVAWLSLDAEDDDPYAFFLYLAHAVGHCGSAKVAARLADFGPPPDAAAAQSQLHQLLELLGGESAHAYVIIDDFHHIAHERILHALPLLMRDLPHTLHFILASRTAPDFPMARLRAAGDLVEVDFGDLRFNAAECAEFFRRSPHLSLREPEVARLVAVTEGWVTGLRLLDIALRKRSVAEISAEDLARNRSLHEYLIEVVLAGLPAATLEFLLRTSILDRLCAALCDEVTGDSGSAGMIEAIEKQSLFLCAIDDHSGWYAYHPLFAETLRQTLSRERPDLERLLHRRAAGWFLSRNNRSDALLHALAAGDDDLAATLVEADDDPVEVHGFRNFPRILEWYDGLPDDARRSHPKLALVLAYHCVTKVYWRRALQLLAEPAPEPDTYAVDRLGLRSIAAYYRVDPSAAAMGEAFLERRNESRIPGLEKAVAIHLAGAYNIAGRMDRANTLLARGRYIPARAANSFFELQRDKVALAVDNVYRGRFRETVALCRGIIAELRGRHLLDNHMGCATISILVASLYEMGELDEAASLIQEWAGLIEEYAVPASLCGVHRIWTRLLFVREGATAALAHAGRAIDICMARQAETVVSVLLFEKGRLMLWQGDRTGAADMLRRLSAENDRRFANLAVGWASCAPIGLGLQANLMIAQGMAAEAADLLAAPIDELRQRGATVGYWSLEAIRLGADWRLGADGTLSRLRDLLAETEGAGALRAIVDHGVNLGEPVRVLLEEARMSVLAGTGPSVAYLERLAAAYAAEGGKGATAEIAPAQGSPAKNRLSAREVDIMRCIATGMTNKEIARTLDLSVETVKWHLRNVFERLQVGSRRRALAVVRDSGWI